MYQTNESGEIQALHKKALMAIMDEVLVYFYEVYFNYYFKIKSHVKSSNPMLSYSCTSCCFKLNL